MDGMEEMRGILSHFGPSRLDATRKGATCLRCTTTFIEGRCHHCAQDFLNYIGRRTHPLRQQVRAVVDHLEITGYPVDAKAIAEANGVRVVKTELPPSLWGLICYDRHVDTIIVNQGLPPAYQQFAIGHEFYHWRMGDETVPLEVCEEYLEAEIERRTGGILSPQEMSNELRADLFAVELRVPSCYLLIEALRKRTVAEMARIFQTEEFSIRCRLWLLGLNASDLSFSALAWCWKTEIGRQGRSLVKRTFGYAPLDLQLSDVEFFSRASSPLTVLRSAVETGLRLVTETIGTATESLDVATALVS